MITTINSNLRVFMIQSIGCTRRTYFCNLDGIEAILCSEIDKGEEYMISEFWNYKFKRMGKKRLNEMLKANQFTFQIK